MVSMKIKERVTAALNRIESEVSSLHPKMCTALEIISDSVEELSSIVIKLEFARNYIMVWANQQKKPILDGGLRGEFSRSVSLDIVDRPPSVLRGDDPVEAGMDLAQQKLSYFSASPSKVNRISDWADESSILAEINRVQETMDRVNEEILTKSHTLLELDAATDMALMGLTSNEEPRGEDSDRVGRARRCGEISRPRGGPPRIRSPNINENAMNMDNEKDNLLPPQGIRTPSGRRTSPTVPGACVSPSRAGPSPPLLAGGDIPMITARIEGEADCRDPLDLTFVDCLSAVENEPQQQEVPSLEEAAASTPANTNRAKRKAKKISPDAIRLATRRRE
ncbi:hypothetical protein RF55_12527 [Lasius niger]|uniref:Uncharacterized protein n=1 Tax=Lasius niger TaxID=67767 RepID=A0A0J7N5T5_LASNI|nr:hypothetical protein RF55_12527 [Lasius niger]